MQHAHILEHDTWAQNVQAYLASIAYVDEQIGLLLDAWLASPPCRTRHYLFMG